MRGNKRSQLMHEERQRLEKMRSAESKVRKEKRKAIGKAEDLARAIECSPAGVKAAEARDEKRGTARRKEQANYQKTRARAAARMGGRRKQIQSELQSKPEE